MALSCWKSYPVNLTAAYEGSDSAVQCQVYLRDSEEAPWLEVCTVELTAEPRPLGRLEFIFHCKQDLRFAVQQDDGSTAEVSLASLLIYHSLALPLSGDGQLQVTAVELKVPDSVAYLRLSGQDLADKDVFSLSDPFFTLSSDTREVYRSEIIQDNLNPRWKAFEVSTRTLCKNDFDKLVKIAVYDDDEGSAELIGEAGCGGVGSIRVGEIAPAAAEVPGVIEVHALAVKAGVALWVKEGVWRQRIVIKIDDNRLRAGCNCQQRCSGDCV